MGLLLCIRNQTAIFFSRKAHPLLSGESRASQAEHQELVGDILLSLRALYIRNVPAGCTVNEHYC